ncbi:enoyl-ACP reductase FabI [Desulfoluna spongiiphila]|uniref:Enoyl-[acyl-carrier-protein] reductase [NADH] n=1 Tax=Desulfoluna spongiiphila TaxID=419481 RepID=A0A1G5IS35_9BACT|nr:SDR family oxidoreductase [Desulfoluna spongiiphila]SCY78560.1 Enoyl-[acyl-carrier-protein] reductase [NADH] [Desulfoluna spongiiphila]VVS92534.1 enoyl-[acyl-carrier-protein] reductase (nadh) [Desulfoluna spongiiphila]
MTDKNALIIGIRNTESLCTSIAAEVKKAGYTLYATYQDEDTREHVERVAEDLGIRRLFKYDARKDEDLDAFVAAFKAEGVKLDALVHGISYSTASGAKLNLPLVQVEWGEFTDAIRVGAFSLVEVSGRLLDVFREDASILAVSLRWGRVAVPNFNVVCAAKAALESMVRGLAQSLGKARKMKVNGISPGFVPTYSLAKVGNTLELLEKARDASPLKTNVRKEDVASLSVSLLENNSISGMVYTIDCGVEIMER